MKRIAWLGTRTEKFEETTVFFRDVLGLAEVQVRPGFAMLKLPDADLDFVEVFGADDPESAFYTTGPVAGLLVDDIEAARAELETTDGVELIGSIEWAGDVGIELAEGESRYGWFHLRAPDGNVYAVLQGSRALAD